VLLKVGNQGGAGLVGVAAVGFQIVHQVAVLVPRLVEYFHDPHTTLHHPARQQAGEKKAARRERVSRQAPYGERSFVAESHCVEGC
jgi:hypothetical protein